MSSTDHPFWRHNNPILWGVIATAGVSFFALWTAFLPVCINGGVLGQSCEDTKWSAFVTAPPNEVGDTLAGFAGTLAFLWIIITVWLQSQELAAQREELKETRNELKLTRIAHEKQLDVMELQAHIFQDEQNQRLQARTTELLEHKLRRIRILATKISMLEIREPFLTLEYVCVNLNHQGNEYDLAKSLLEVFEQILQIDVKDFLEADSLEKSNIPKLQDHILELRSVLVDIQDFQYELSAGQVQRLFNFEFDKLLIYSERTLGHMMAFYNGIPDTLSEDELMKLLSRLSQ